MEEGWSKRRATGCVNPSPTRLFGVRETLDTPFISVVDGPILKLYGVVIVNTGRSYLMHKGA